MKSHEFLSEGINVRTLRSLAPILRAECQLFLTQLNYEVGKYSLWRGIGYMPDSMLNKSPCPVNRQPKDTPQDLHKIADDWFLENYGAKYRSNAVFATGAYDIAGDYGKQVAIFPIGTYTICWSRKVLDLTQEIDGLPWPVPNKFGDDHSTEIKLNQMLKILESGDYLSTNLIGAIASDNEIMIHCPQGYYTVMMSEEDPFRDMEKLEKVLRGK